MGIKSYDSAINGNGKFFKAIIKGLGPIDTILMSAKLNRMFSKQREFGRFTVGLVQDFKNIQDELLRKCFDKRFSKINNITDAKKYMELLRNFETYRGKITYLTKDGTIVEDNTFKEYYQERYQALIYKFPDKLSNLEEYTYKEQEYKPTEDQIQKYRENVIRNSLLSAMIQEVNGNLDSIPRNIQVSMKRNADFYFVYNINGNQLTRDELEKYSYIGKRRYIEWESVKLRNPECNFYEQCSIFIDDMRSKGRSFEDETLDISYKENEINNRLLPEQKKEHKENNQLKKITFIDKIRSKINSFLNRRAIIQNQSNASMEALRNTENISEETKLPSWDLRNWSEEEMLNQGINQGDERGTTGIDLHGNNDYDDPNDEYYK